LLADEAWISSKRITVVARDGASLTPLDAQEEDSREMEKLARRTRPAAPTR
jgi:hypothetical protein